MQCPICGVELNNLNDLKFHFNYELKEIVKLDVQFEANKNKIKKQDSRFLVGLLKHFFICQKCLLIYD